ncbi:MAG: magnesium/cobalt transporter CorA [Halobacteria archaeon]
MNVDCTSFNKSGVEEFDKLEEVGEVDDKLWIHGVNVDGKVVDQLEDIFGIHSLSVEDVYQETTQPKTEEFENHTFVLLKTARLSRGDVSFNKEVMTESIGFFIADDWIVTLATDDISEVNQVMSKLRSGGSRIEKKAPDFLAYEIMDRVIDSYFSLLDTIDEELQAVDDRVLAGVDTETLDDINSVRRDLLAFRKILWPTREAVYALSRGGLNGISEDSEKYYRDIYDHVVQEVDLLETYRDLASGSRDIYINRVSQSTNEVMKVLTIVATIFIPLTFIAGIYGMNFDGGPYNMPELDWAFAYPAVLLGMLLIVVVMLSYFRNREWI